MSRGGRPDLVLSRVEQDCHERNCLSFRRSRPFGGASAAVNAGAAIPGMTDQRGFTRTGVPDIGAYELLPVSYAYWAAHTFPNATNAAAWQDRDGDGVANGLEFAAGTDPMNANATPVMTPAVTGGIFSVTFTLSPLLPDDFARVSLSGDLITWTPAAAGAYTVLGSSPDGVNRLVKVSAPAAVPRRFARWELSP